MKAMFKSELSDVEIKNIKEFCDSADYFSLEQSLGFPEILYGTKITYFYLTDNDTIKSFCQINENFRVAHIWFGPVCCDKEIMVTSINEIINYYKKRGFWYLGIQMYYKSGYDTEFIEYALNKEHSIKYIFNNENTKSSLEIDLKNSLDDIYNSIRKGHKSDIKKALKEGITVEELKDENELILFTDVYLKMCKTRAIGGHSADEINGICNYLIKNKKGKILLAKDRKSIIIGGAILAYQGISVRYLLGASDPDRRDLPLLHLVIYQAIEGAKINNFRYFDFWGYNHFAKESDQGYNINHFKKGFGGYYTFFAKKMNINLIPFGYRIFRISVCIRKLINKIHKI
jgi:lipid II:glycine glycyltransferase (peptidoglycan interpeptide bridge formation enzyme)